jgi:hypothetical protein
MTQGWPVLAAHLHVEQDLEAAAGRRGVDAGVVAGDDAGPLEGADAAQARGRGQADAVGQVGVGQAAVDGQLGDNCAIDPVHGITC